jgi:2-polyprenyl-3-methyl-5-hydroxy-6-metoxy-1,4-benzoquinol methylase
METLSTCPACGSSRIKEGLSCKDYVASSEVFTLWRCEACTFLFTNPRPSASEIAPYYQSDRYVSHAGSKQDFSFIYRIYDIVRGITTRMKIRLIKKYHASGTLLDLGCGLGHFLEGISRDGTFTAIGVDISEEAIAFVKKMFDIEVKKESELDSFGPFSFDVITQWHVLEHVHLLDERMKQLKYLLKPNGTMFIAVPNSDSLDARIYGPAWDGYDVPRHLYHFNRKSFSLLMQKHGFEVIDIKAMPFDAPYISMRSEVHKGRSLPFVRGAFMGLASTVRGMTTGDHSSLLFVVKNRP